MKGMEVEYRFDEYNIIKAVVCSEVYIAAVEKRYASDNFKVDTSCVVLIDEDNRLYEDVPVIELSVLDRGGL